MCPFMSVSKPLAFLLFDWLESRHEVSRGDTKPASHFVVIYQTMQVSISNNQPLKPPINELK